MPRVLRNGPHPRAEDHPTQMTSPLTEALLHAIASPVPCGLPLPTTAAYMRTGRLQTQRPLLLLARQDVEFPRCLFSLPSPLSSEWNYAVPDPRGSRRTRSRHVCLRLPPKPVYHFFLLGVLRSECRLLWTLGLCSTPEPNPAFLLGSREAWNSLCGSGWLWIHGDSSASVSS